MNELLNNNWFVSIASSLIMLAIIPVGSFVVNTIRARRGVFSGYYIAVTSIRRSKDQIVELVKCKHIGRTVKGYIYSIAIIKKDGLEEKILPNNCIYKFKGSVKERLIVASYFSIAKGDSSAGVLTLLGNTTGNIFSGAWGGLEEGEIISSDCEWTKSGKKLSRENDFDYIINQTKMNSTTLIKGDNASGKSSFLYKK